LPWAEPVVDLAGEDIDQLGAIECPRLVFRVNDNCHTVYLNPVLIEISNSQALMISNRRITSA
jgi:hypothetical protein